MTLATLFSDRLGLHQLAYARAVTEGLPMREMAERYLGITHGAAAPRAHQFTMDLVRAVARRQGDPRWRLIGLRIAEDAEADEAPSLAEWAASSGLDDGWSEAELVEMYHEAFGQEDPQRARRRQRNARLRTRRLQLLDQLAKTAVVPARPGDLLNSWFAPDLASALQARGLLTLQDLRARIRAGGAWWDSLRGFGAVKAKRVEDHLQLLLAGYPEVDKPEDRWSGTGGLAVLDAVSRKQAGQLVKLAHTRALSLGEGGPPVLGASPSALSATDDQEAVTAWIAARAGSTATAKLYEREVGRYRLWLAIERGRSLSQATAEDCRAYMDFLQEVPQAWISRRKVARHQEGWAPWRKQPSHSSQQLALDALAACHVWLKAACYLRSNPWLLVNHHLGDDPKTMRGSEDPTSRAFTPEAWRAMRDQVEADALSTRPRDQHAARRHRWLLTFGEACGLRISEMLGATVGDLRQTSEGYVLRVYGKGRRRRAVPVPTRAMEATRQYLASRGLAVDEACANVPLVGAVGQSRDAPSYSALAQSIKSLVRRASRRLPLAEATQMSRASAHWLRHTHATRAAERDVPIDVLQENLGQADPRTTARYYRAQMKRRAFVMERAFGQQDRSA
jgi:integrase